MSNWQSEGNIFGLPGAPRPQFSAPPSGNTARLSSYAKLFWRAVRRPCVGRRLQRHADRSRRLRRNAGSMMPCSGRRCATAIDALSSRGGPMRCGRSTRTSGSTHSGKYFRNACNSPPRSSRRGSRRRGRPSRRSRRRRPRRSNPTRPRRRQAPGALAGLWETRRSPAHERGRSCAITRRRQMSLTPSSTWP
jgi:hypothetical protein